MRSKSSLRRPAAAMRAGALVAGVALALALAPAARADEPPKDTVRAEVGTPLQAAQKLIQDKKFRDALAKVKEAEVVPNRTPYENYMIESLRAPAALFAGDDDVAIASYETLIASGRLPPANQSRFLQVLASEYYKLKNYPKAAAAANRYLKEGGTEPSVQDIEFASYYYGNDFKTAATELQASVEADEKAGRTTPESRLQMLLNSDMKIGNPSGASAVLERLLTSYPQKQYWDMAISHVVHRAGFAERLDLDLLRLEFALGDLHKDNDFMSMAQLCLEAGFPLEAKKVLDAGFAAGALGKGAEADRQKRLLAKASKDADDDARSLGTGDTDADKAKSGDGMVNNGYNYVLHGKFEKGLSLMEQGLKKGGLRHAEDQKMHLGMAYSQAGDKARAVQTLRSVGGTDGTSELSHLWAIYIASGKH